ncbi:TonB-dependent receptor [Verrucomicrobia bacterium]|nr:TonB-dependent receptor [Verrucomicrobiota bacterium]MDB4778725.1 TonB-dependent receptor [Verrucomicrobiota bacterium]
MKILLLMLATIIGLGSTVLAQVVDDLLELPPVVVTPSRSARPLFDAPNSVALISNDELERNMYRTTPQILGDTPGIMVQETSPGQGSPFIRGFTAFRNILLIDGVRLNNSVFRDGPNQYWNSVDPLSMESVEVLKGPGSVQYGSDGVGGVVSVNTLSPSVYGDGFEYGGRAYYRVSSAENSHMVRAESQVALDHRTGVIAGVSYKQFGSVVAGGGTGTQDGTGYEEWDFDLKFEHHINPHHSFVLAYQNVEQNNVPRTHKTINGISYKGSAIGSEIHRDSDQLRRLTYIQWHVHDLDGFVDSMQTSLSWHVQEELRDRLRSRGRQDYQGFDVDTFGFFSQLQSETPVGDLSYGVDYYHDEVDSFSSRNPIQGAVGDDASYDLAGIFVQDTIDLSERWNFSLGGRFTYAGANADKVEDPVSGNQVSVDRDWGNTVGNARLVYKVKPDTWNIFGGIAQGFRAPNLTDLTSQIDTGANEQEIPAISLEPEKYLTYEIGTRVHYQRFSAELAGFYTDVNDMINRFPTGVVTADGKTEVGKANVGDGFVTGIEYGMAYEIHPEWTLFGNATYMDGEMDVMTGPGPVASAEYLSRGMPLSGQVGLRWMSEQRRFQAQIRGVLSATADHLSSRDRRDTERIPPGGTPGYERIDLKVGWNIHTNLTITVAIDNMTNQNYRVHGSGTNSPGRNFIAALESRF